MRRPEIHINVLGKPYAVKTEPGKDTRMVPEYDPATGKTVAKELRDKHDVTSLTTIHEAGDGKHEVQTERIYYPTEDGPVVVEEHGGRLRKIGFIHPKGEKSQ